MVTDSARWIHLQKSELFSLCDEKLKELVLLVDNNLAWIAECNLGPRLEPDASTSAKLEKEKDKPVKGKSKSEGTNQKNFRQGKRASQTTSSFEQISPRNSILASPHETPPLQRIVEQTSREELYNSDKRLKANALEISDTPLSDEGVLSNLPKDDEEEHNDFVFSASSNHLPGELPGANIDMKLELRERRLKDYFNSNTEKLKKALSSLRSAPHQSVLPSAQRAASLDIGPDLHRPHPFLASILTNNNLQQKKTTQTATFESERNADSESPLYSDCGSDAQMDESNSNVKTAPAVPSPASSSSSSSSTMTTSSVRAIPVPCFSKIGQLPPNLVMSTTSFVAELAEKGRAKQLEKERQRERDRKPEVKALLTAASAAKKEQIDKERRAAAKNLGMDRHALAQQKKVAEEAKRLEALRKKEEEVRKRAKAALEAKKKEEEELRKRRKDRDRQVQERQRQLAKEREELQQRVLNKVKKLPDKGEKEAEIRQAESRKRIRLVGDEEEQNTSSSVPSIRKLSSLVARAKSVFEPELEIESNRHLSVKKMSTLVARAKSVLEPETEIESKRQKTNNESSHSFSREQKQPLNKNAHSTPTTKNNSGFVQLQYTSKGMVARPRTPLTIFSGSNADCATPELPEIHTDDDSDDENYSSRKDRPQPDYPDWTQSPAIRQAMLRQSASNPDTIFNGTMRTLDMEEIFSCRDKRFRSRSSSAQWSGTDKLTAQEELKYQQAMGYKD